MSNRQDLSKPPALAGSADFASTGTEASFRVEALLRSLSFINMICYILDKRTSRLAGLCLLCGGSGSGDCSRSLIQGFRVLGSISCLGFQGQVGSQ